MRARAPSPPPPPPPPEGVGSTVGSGFLQVSGSTGGFMREGTTSIQPCICMVPSGIFTTFGVYAFDGSVPSFLGVNGTITVFSSTTVTVASFGTYSGCVGLHVPSLSMKGTQTVHGLPPGFGGAGPEHNAGKAGTVGLATGTQPSNKV